MKDTLNSGKEVEKESKTKPIVVFPSPEISDTLMALVIVTWLNWSRVTKETNKRIKLTRISTLSHIQCKNNCKQNKFTAANLEKGKA